MESQNQNPYHTPTPEHPQGDKDADKERKRLCELVLENARVKKLEKLKGKDIKKK